MMARKGGGRRPLTMRSNAASPPGAPVKKRDPRRDSPASVVTVSLSDDSSSSQLRSTVAMSDSGAEVTLDLSSLSVHDVPKKQEAVSRSDSWDSTSSPTNNVQLQRKALASMNASLLDDDCTPSPAKRSTASVVSTSLNHSTLTGDMSPQRLLTGGYCCGAPRCLPGLAEESFVVEDRHEVQGQITSMLSRPGDSLCSGWQAWSSTRIAEEDESFQHEEDEERELTAEHVHRILHNRAFDMAARRQRLSTIRRDLNPFQVSPQKETSASSRKVRSFDIHEHAPSLARRSSQAPASSLPSVWESVSCNPTLPPADSPYVVRSRWTSTLQDDGYDSDPEDFYRRGGSPNDRRSSFTGTESGTVTMSLVKEDDANLVQEFMNERLTLILHPTSSTSIGSPQAVSAWVERGQRFNDKLYSPRFVWKTDQEEVSRSRVVRERAVAPGVDVLDIKRILNVSEKNVDRAKTPFVRVRHSFTMKTIKGESFLFEASSPEERDSIVRSLKLLVARLGSKLVVEDETVLEEFFVGVLNNQDGHGPRW